MSQLDAVDGTAHDTTASDAVAPTTALAVVGATRRFGDVVALNSVDVEVGQREIVALLGPSGCGKTTLLRSIAGLERLDRGTILIHGRDVTRAEPQTRGVALVFQDGALFPHLTAERNIRVAIDGGRRVARGSDADKRVKEIASLLRIDHLLSRVPHQLSGGQRQRVGIARALVCDPELLLMDEPFASLDADLRLELRREIRRLHRSNAIAETVFVTHDQTEALGIADRIAVMFDGRIAQIGTPKELLDAPVSLTVAQFLGVPKINTIVTEHELVLAFRPSDCLAGDTSRDDSLSVDGTVIAVEPFGGNWLTTLRTASGKEFEGVVSWTAAPTVGDRLSLACAIGRLYCFDKATGERRVVSVEQVGMLWASL